MFGGSTSSLGKTEGAESKPDAKAPSPEPSSSAASTASASTSASAPAPAPTGGPSSAPSPPKPTEQVASGEKRSGNGGLPTRQDTGGSSDKKRRSSGVGGKASSLLASAKNSLNNFGQGGRGSGSDPQSQGSKVGKQDAGASAAHNNSAGESLPGPRSTFRVGVWEDKNRKCRRTMEDTHAFLYNFLATPASQKTDDAATESGDGEVVETDNGYFAIFDGHAGTFAADWCGKKLHLILEEIIRKNPNHPIPELLDQTFTAVDSQLEKLPVKNSGCTAAVAVLRWEERAPAGLLTPGLQSGSLSAIANAPTMKATSAPSAAADATKTESTQSDAGATPETGNPRLKSGPTRSRVLYTANVGDARIILCRSGKALRLSYDHKGSDENEGRRIANAGGLILNNRVNGVLAVTRALGDAYMKDLVTGHPYTTETVVQADTDEFIIIACDGLWDVCSDQEAVDLVREVEDPTAGAKALVDHALSRFSTDNLSCMIVRLDRDGHFEAQGIKDQSAPGAETDHAGNARKSGEAEQAPADDGSFKPTLLDRTVEEEPGPMEGSDGSARGSSTDESTTPVAAKSES